VTANNSTYSYTISGAGAIAGSTGLLKQGTGTMTLLNANTYTGGTTISAGTLQLGDGATANGSVAGNITVTSPGNLVFANPNPQTYSRAITGTGLVTVQGPALLTLGDGVANNGTVAGNILDNASLAFANPFAETYSGVISGAGSLTELGPGTLTLNNASLVGDGTTITAGALRLGDGATANGSVGNITDNAKLIFANPSAQNYSGLISGSGSLTASGPGALTLSGLSTYTGVTTLSGGTVQVDSTETAGTSGPLGKSAAANPGSIAFSGGTLQFSGANANDYSGRFSTAASQAYKVDVNGQPVTFGTALTSSGGALTLSDTAGGGSLTLTAANSYSGATTINTGAKLTIGSPGDLGSGSYAGAIANGGTFTYASSAAQTLSGGITGSGTLIVNNSAAVLTLTAALANTTVDIISGNLTANMANPNVFAPGTIITFGGVGTSGTLDLFGRTTVNISQIAVAAGATASSQIIQNGATGNNATLQINGTCSFGGNIVAGPGTGTTALTVSGAGVTLTLSGNNTYAGATTISSGSVLTISGSGTLPSAPAESFPVLAR
jgi:autotransporter-associated beta strand protein